MSLRAIALRILALAAIVIAFGLLNSQLRNDDAVVGANIGAGLAYFLCIFVTSALWGLIDGRRADRLSPIVLGWVVIALVVACIEFARLAIASHESFGTAFTLYADTWPFWVGLVAIPGCVGATVGQMFRRAGDS